LVFPTAGAGADQATAGVTSGGGERPALPLVLALSVDIPGTSLNCVWLPELLEAWVSVGGISRSSSPLPCAAPVEEIGQSYQIRLHMPCGLGWNAVVSGWRMVPSDHVLARLKSYSACLN